MYYFNYFLYFLPSKILHVHLIRKLPLLFPLQSPLPNLKHLLYTPQLPFGTFHYRHLVHSVFYIYQYIYIKSTSLWNIKKRCFCVNCFLQWDKDNEQTIELSIRNVDISVTKWVVWENPNTFKKIHHLTGNCLSTNNRSTRPLPFKQTHNKERKKV